MAALVLWWDGMMCCVWRGAEMGVYANGIRRFRVGRVWGDGDEAAEAPLCPRLVGRRWHFWSHCSQKNYDGSAKVEAITKWPRPTPVTEVLEFSGLAGDFNSYSDASRRVLAVYSSAWKVISLCLTTAKAPMKLTILLMI
ncbi:hypothetical protein Tco_1352170 [Tanacetum coccineum]|uniref:Uncharacterized protein n=1 Tax=Tanacetum coccineum TaxID=301880 RepID=A0ABQ4ZXS5_9ASTR